MEGIKMNENTMRTNKAGLLAGGFILAAIAILSALTTIY